MEFTLRGWQPEDDTSTAKYADNAKIAANLRDGFPYPYSLEAAQLFIKKCMEADKSQKLFYAIDVNGEAVGSIGVFKKDDVYLKSAELGYWLGEPFWGQGVMTRAVYQVCRIAFVQLDVVRIAAEPFAHNTGSRKVLENAGFELEGIHRASIYKNGQIGDSCTYALIRQEKEN
jgi:[ribosomal protein S5]-alanine N-acetyltransferase